MGIDRIGRVGGGSGVAPPVTSPATEATGPSEPFRIGAKTPVDKAAAVSPLDRLRAGEIDMNTYLDQRVEAATQHLIGKVDADQLDFIRTTLRSQLTSDPMLVELVQKASGQTPKPSDEG